MSTTKLIFLFVNCCQLHYQYVLATYLIYHKLMILSIHKIQFFIIRCIFHIQQTSYILKKPTAITYKIQVKSIDFFLNNSHSYV